MNQWLDLERLRDIVVRPHVKANDFINFFTAGCHHQDSRRLGPWITADLSTDFQSVDDRQHQIKNHEVRLLALNASQTILTIRGNDDLKPFFYEIVREYFLK